MQKKHNEKTSCAVLAGGKNSRMGKHKAFLEYEGKTFIKIICDNMSCFFEEIFIITNDRTLFNGISIAPVFEDIIPNKGPLGAICTAFDVSQKDNIFCIGCDMPFAKPSLLEKLLDSMENTEYDCYVPKGKKGAEPLYSIYNRKIINKMLESINKGELRMQKFIRNTDAYYVDIEGDNEELININTPEEYKYYGS